MARNTGKIKRGFSYDTSNSRLDVYVDGTKVISFDGANAKSVFDGQDIELNDSDYLIFGDGDDVAVSWDATNLTWIPATDDTGSFNIGNGTKDMDFKVFLGTTASYVLADVGNKYLSLIQTYLYAPNFPSSSPTAGVVYRSATTGALYT